MNAYEDRVAEFNLLMLGMVLRVFRMTGPSQVDELKKLLTFVENIPEQFVSEARAVLEEFNGDSGVWGFLRLETEQGQLTGDEILQEIRVRI